MTCLLLTLLLVSGITGKIQGTIKNEDTGRPIVDANVVILNSEQGASTDNDGNFYILNVPPGNYTVEASCIGYQPKRFENVVVEIDRTAWLNINLTQITIEVEPIVVTGQMPAVKKDMIGTTYIVRKEEIYYMPIDYTPGIVIFQPAVAHADTAIHVRGGRATEVQYMIDNVSIVDPQTGDLAINMSRDIVDEVIFLPGGFDVEYGRAMSGIINLITTYPSDNLHVRTYSKTERIMPFYYDFGFENYRSSIHLPISKKAKGYISIDLMHTDDWDPRLYILPHKQRDDYSLYSKWLFVPVGKLRLTLSGAKSRTQFDRYNTRWKFRLDHYRSDKREGDLGILNLTYLPNQKNLLGLTVSRLYTKRTFGVRIEERAGFFRDFVFRDYKTLRWPTSSNKNPFGVRYVGDKILCEGDFPEYGEKSTRILNCKVGFNSQINKYNEMKGGVDYSNLKLDNFNIFYGDSIHQLIDKYHYLPKEISLFIQNNIDYKGLCAKLGCRYDYFATGIDTIVNSIISPRFGFSFMVTEKFLFRANLGQYTQPPLYDHLYRYYDLLPFPSYYYSRFGQPLVGNPGLKPEKTRSYEIGFQGEITPDLIATLNTYYKDVFELIGTRLVSSLPRSYVSYFNVEYANIKGSELILEFKNRIFTGKISYSLSYARGSSSYAEEVYYRYYYETIDTDYVLPAQDYYLDFDQRHKIFIQGIFNLPKAIEIYLFGHLGNGFPYTPAGPEGKYAERNIEKLPFQREIDCFVTKGFVVGNLSFNINCEVLNLLNERYQIAPIYPFIPEENINYWDFNDYISILGQYYHPAADVNHDGLITPREEYEAFKALNRETADWVNCYTAPCRLRIGITINY